MIDRLYKEVIMRATNVLPITRNQNPPVFIVAENFPHLLAFPGAFLT